LADIRSGSISVARSGAILKATFSLKSHDLLFGLAFGGLVLLLSQGRSMAFAIVWMACGVSYLVRWLRFHRFVRRCVGDAFDEWVTMAKVA
jgi:hypothetical protein